MDRLVRYSLPVLGVVLLILAWHFYVVAFNVPPAVLPKPGLVLDSMIANWRAIVQEGRVTLLESLYGFLLAFALGIPLAVAISSSRTLNLMFYPLLIATQSVPKVALAPLIVIWFGLGLTSKVINAALVAFFPLLVNTMVGLRSADEDRVSLMRSLSASNTQIFWMLRLPNALPFVMAGLDIAMILALIGAIVAEFTGATAGLGMLILSMTYTMDVSGQFSVLLILSVVGLLLNRLVYLVRRRVLFWDPSEKGVEVPEGEVTTRTPLAASGAAKESAA